MKIKTAKKLELLQVSTAVIVVCRFHVPSSTMGFPYWQTKGFSAEEKSQLQGLYKSHGAQPFESVDLKLALICLGYITLRDAIVRNQGHYIFSREIST